MSETWKPLPDPIFSDTYQVSNTGKVRSVDRIVATRGGWKQLMHGCEKKLRKTLKGYYVVELWDSKPDKPRCHTRSVARLVALAFIPNPDNLDQVTHRDRNLSNNHVDNLKWISQSEKNKRTMAEHPQYRNRMGEHQKDKKRQRLLKEYIKYKKQKQPKFELVYSASPCM